MIRTQYVSGTSESFQFRVNVDGSYAALGAYSVDFRGTSNLSAVSYHLSAASASATVISVPYTALLASGQVARGTFNVRNPDGEFTQSDPVHITLR
jgi:hypothetical protein